MINSETKTAQQLQQEADIYLIGQMGYDTSAVSVTERGYVVEGDILLRHEYLAELKTIEPTRQTQDVSRNVVSAEKRTINIVTSGVLDYYDAIQEAIDYWNQKAQCAITFATSGAGEIVISAEYNSDNDDTSLMFVTPPDFSGNPGSVIINMSCTYRPGTGTTQARDMILHAIGHAIGFGHTACAADSNPEGFPIPGLNSIDEKSIMTKETNPLRWSGFSENDIKAFKAVYPTDEPEPEPEAPALTLAQSTEATRVLDLELYSSSAVLVDVQSGTGLAEKAPDAKIYPASMTKVMTLLVAAENLPDLDATFTMTQAIIDPIYLAGASMAGFVDGETVSMRDLLYGAVVPSGAEATEALAQAVAGSEEAFVTMMNEKAAALGLTSTHFMNTSGLHDEDHYSTVREIALILQAALQNEVCAEVLSAENYRASRTEQHPDGLAMTNKFLYRVHHEYSLGGAEITAAKTGYTAEAMNCCASAGKTPDGRSVICVTANAWTGEFCIEDHIALDSKYCGSAESE